MQDSKLNDLNHSQKKDSGDTSLPRPRPITLAIPDHVLKHIDDALVSSANPHVNDAHVLVSPLGVSFHGTRGLDVEAVV